MGSAYQDAADRVLERARFDSEMRVDREPEVSRGRAVFVDWDSFVRSQDMDVLYHAYCCQINAFLRGKRECVPPLSAFGERAEDIRWLCWRVLDAEREFVMHERVVNRVLAAVGTVNPLPAAPNAPRQRAQLPACIRRPVRWTLPSSRKFVRPRPNQNNGPGFSLSRRRGYQ